MLGRRHSSASRWRHFTSPLAQLAGSSRAQCRCARSASFDQPYNPIRISLAQGQASASEENIGGPYRMACSRSAQVRCVPCTRRAHHHDHARMLGWRYRSSCDDKTPGGFPQGRLDAASATSISPNQGQLLIFLPYTLQEIEQKSFWQRFNGSFLWPEHPQRSAWPLLPTISSSRATMCYTTEKEPSVCSVRAQQGSRGTWHLRLPLRTSTSHEGTYTVSGLAAVAFEVGRGFREPCLVNCTFNLELPSSLPSLSFSSHSYDLL